MSHVRRAEVAHDSTLETLGQKLDESMRAFEQLDLSLNQEHSYKNGIGVNSHAGGNVALQQPGLDKKLCIITEGLASLYFAIPVAYLILSRLLLAAPR